MRGPTAYAVPPSTIEDHSTSRLCFVHLYKALFLKICLDKNKSLQIISGQPQTGPFPPGVFAGGAAAAPTPASACAGEGVGEVSGEDVGEDASASAALVERFGIEPFPDFSAK